MILHTSSVKFNYLCTVGMLWASEVNLLKLDCNQKGVLFSFVVYIASADFLGKYFFLV